MDSIQIPHVQSRTLDGEGDMKDRSTTAGVAVAEASLSMHEEDDGEIVINQGKNGADGLYINNL